MRLFKQELSACEGQNFQAEFVEVEKVLSQIPERCTDLEGLRTEFYFPSSSVLAGFLSQPAEPSEEVTSSPSSPLAQSSISTAATEAPRGWQLARQTLTAVSMELSWDVRDGVSDAMQRLHKILAKPERRRGYG
ncbi:unnamed protein product [Durusdinium trenchii]|uniref:Uncharacterized protein n=1 Tax=Durusdinium trenchii TaxID=1381693 RepID=A0ABP0RME9_9DINO